MRCNAVQCSAAQSLYRTESNRTKPNQTEPNQTEPNRIKPNQTESNRTDTIGVRGKGQGDWVDVLLQRGERRALVRIAVAARHSGEEGVGLRRVPCTN